jgi:peptidoglycan L-alanyl-D-glutamate endopeptidase CwlK
MAEDVPIVWGGDWRTFKDMPHFELDRRKYPA